MPYKMSRNCAILYSRSINFGCNNRSVDNKKFVPILAKMILDDSLDTRMNKNAPDCALCREKNPLFS